MHKRKGVEESHCRGWDCSSMEHLQQFRRTLGNKRFSSCPSVKRVFGKLRNDLFASFINQYLQNDNYDLHEPLVMGQNIRSPAHCLNSLADSLTHCGDPPFHNKDPPKAACQRLFGTRSFKGDTEENVNGFKGPTAVEGDVQITQKESSEGWMIFARIRSFYRVKMIM